MMELRFARVPNPARGRDVDFAAPRLDPAYPAVRCSRRAGDDGSAGGGAAQHGLVRRHDARLYHRARWRRHSRRSARALSAGVGAAPDLAAAGGGRSARNDCARPSRASAHHGVSGAGCDRPGRVHDGRLRCGVAGRSFVSAGGRDRFGHDHRLRRRRLARHPLQ